MAERVALSAGVDPCPARHCWVLDPADHSGSQRHGLGLLVQWHHTEVGEGTGAGDRSLG